MVHVVDSNILGAFARLGGEPGDHAGYVEWHSPGCACTDCNAPSLIASGSLTIGPDDIAVGTLADGRQIAFVGGGHVLIDVPGAEPD
jgi:hypothetical protein